LKQIDEAVSGYEKRVKETNRETEQMLSTCAKLNSFVQHSVLMASSDIDKMSERLQDRIYASRRKKKAEVGTKLMAAKFEDLQKIQAKYNDAKDKCQGQLYSIHEVDRLIRQLYTLPISGTNLKYCMDIEENERREVVERSRKSNKPISISIVQPGIQAVSKVFATITDPFYRR